MISKESEYLIHAAEEQLERLNKSLYFYQKQSEIESDILSSSISMNCSNNFKDNSSISLDINTNGLNLKTDLKPLYKIIKKQRDEYSSGSSFRRKLKESEKKKQLQKSHSSISCVDNIRDWRNGVNLVKKTLGPNNRLSQKSPVIKSQSVSPCSLKKRERISTFWNDEGNKRNSNSPKKNMSNSNRTENNCCSRRNTDKEEIQRYIRNKQRLAREKRFEADLTLKAKKENIQASLNSLEHYHYDKFTQYLSAKQNYQKHKNDYNYMKSCSMSSLNKSKLPTPIYDELEKDGFLDYFDIRDRDHHFISSMSAKYKNGLNSTVDSGIETGEWYRSLTPEKFRNSYDRINEHNSYLSAHLPTMSQPTSQTDLRQNKKYKDSQFKSSYNNKFKQKYQEQISAYDASSENELMQECEDINKYSQSPELSVVSGEIIKNSKTSSIRIKLGVDENQDILELNSKLSESPSNKRFSSTGMVDNCQNNTAYKLSNDTTNKTDNKISLIQDLKEALFNAQMQLNLENKESEEAVSERIALAVQNFIKTKESLESTRASSCISPQSIHSANQNICDTNTKIKSKGSSQSESKRINKKDLSTEFEATEMDLEMTKKSNRLLTKDVDEDLKETIEINNYESTHDINIENNNLTNLDLSENLPKPNDISIFKETLQKREERANELIKLTKDLQKESKRVIKLERKAFEITKRFIPGLKADNKVYRTDDQTTFSKHLALSDNKNDENFSEYQQTVKMTNPHFHPNDSSNELPELDKPFQSQSSQSENDEITISISEVTTTLTDQSELEARLLALQSEMKKKKQLVSTLKRRQKDMKRDKIKQKEVVLQKQIEMYDDYIEKLQTSVNQLNSKIDEFGEEDNNSDDSHTLTGSNLNLTDLDSKKSHDYIQNDNQPENLLIDIDNHDTDNILINNVMPILSTEQCELQDILNTEITSNSRTGSLDSLIENNKHIQLNDQDLDNLLDMIENYQDDDDNEKENEHGNDKESDKMADKTSIDDMINSSKLKRDDKSHPLERLLLDDFNEFIPQNEVDKLFDFTTDINSENLDQNVNTNVDFTIGPTDEFDLNDLVENSEDKESVNDAMLHRLYLKANNSDIGDTNLLLDNLLPTNTEPIFLSEFEKSQINQLILSNNEEIKSSESHNEFDDKKKPILVEDILEICITDKENQKDIDNDDQSVSDVSSHSSSLKLRNVNQMKVKTDKEKPAPILVENIDDEENLENEIHFAEIIAESKSSIPDIDSESISDSYIDSLEVAKPIEILHDSDSDANIGKCEITIQNTPSSHISPRKIEEISNHSLDNDILNHTPEKSINYTNVDELVDILLNKLIISEIENFKPNLAEIHQENLSPQTPESVVQNQSTSLIEENVNNLPLIEGKDIVTNVLKSEDLWDLSELTAEDPWKMENTIVTDIDDPNIPFTSTIPELDRELLKEKVSWLIPLKSEYIDPLVESAIKHFMEYKKIHSVITEEVLSNEENNLPYLYSIADPIVDETEIISALFESVSQKSYIDKRIIFHIVLEIILEIYLFENHLPQPPWIQSSYMLKNNVYSLWKGDTAPESFDLVKKIVRRRIDVLINQKNISTTDSKFLIKENDSQSKIIRWCIRQQKDDVDKLLINDLRKEENEWIYYDEAEEEVKFQIAEEIFHILVIDTISWIKSISDEN